MRLKRAAKKLKRSRFVSAGLKKHVQHLSLVINGPPEIHLLATDLQEDLVNVPCKAWLGPLYPKPLRILPTKFLNPAADRLV